MADGYISQIKTPDNKVYLLKDSEKGYKWNAVTQGQKWSRICLITPTILTEGSSGILSISCTRDSVVCNATFLITTSHSSKCFINTLGTTNYSAVRIRGVVQSNGTAYIELYDTARSIASGTAQTWHCSYIPILGSTLTTYTSFTDGTTVPSGYTAANDFTAPQGDNSAPIVSITRNSGTTFTATRSNGTTFTFTQQDSDTKSFTITANATDGLWDLTGTNGTNAVTYALAPYSAKGSAASFYTAATNPTLTTRLNYDGYLYATKLYSGGSEVLTAHRTYTAFTGKPTGNQTPGFGDTFTIQQISQSTTGQVSGTDRTVTIPTTEASTSAVGLVGTAAQTFGGTKTFNGGMHIYGSISMSGTGTTNMQSGGAYHAGHNSLVLHGDSAGVSGIGFTSQKATDSSNAANINSPSDRAFIQYHAYGVTPAAEGTAPTLATSGEHGTLVIGVGNDGSSTSEDFLLLQVPGATGLKHQIGTTAYPIPYTINTNGSVGGTTTPVYVDGGAIKALSYTIAKSVPSDAVFTDHYAWSEITDKPATATRWPAWSEITSKPTTLSGYGITDAKIASGVITLGSNTITPITSIADLTGSTITAANLRTNLGLSAALRFIGKATTDMSESTTTAPTVTGVTNYAPEVGDVVLDKNSDAEYVCIAKTTANSTTTYTWELLGRSGSWATSTHTHGNITNGGLLGAASVAVVTDGSKKITTADLSVSDPTAATTTSTTFIDTISQSAQGKITATKKTLPSASSSVAGIVKLGASGGAATYSHDHNSTYLKLDGSNNMTADVNIIAGDTDKFINFWYNTGKTAGASWRTGMLGSGSSDTNYFVIQSGTSTTSATAWNNVLRLGQNTYDAGFGGNVYPLTNNSKTLGTSSLKWNNVYATTFTGNLSGNASSADSAKWLMNRGGSTVTISDGPWAHGQAGYGGTNAATVWHQRWKQSGLTYTPSGGSATTLTDSGDMVLWLAQSATSNLLTVNMAVDGIIYAIGGFKGNLTGTASALSNFKVTTTGNLGIDAPGTNAIGYVSGLTKAAWNYQQSDGALYTQFYNASWITEIFQDYRTGQISVRGKNNGTWQSWRRVLDETNGATILGLDVGANNAATLTWGTTYTIAKINGTDIKFTTMAKPSYAFANLTAHPTTLSGYGITDAASSSHSHTLKIGNESLSVNTSTQTWKLTDIQAGPQYHVGSTSNCTYVLVTINAENSWMLAFTLRLYQGYRATDIQISGYNYGSSHWYSPQAVILGDTDTTAKKVYFGYTANWKLWVAVDGSSYTGADVFGVTNGYTQVDWENMMTITKVSSLPGTTQTTATIYRPWYRNETVSTAASANSVAWTNVSGRPTNLNQFTNGPGYITGYTETDPTVPAWAKAATKPSYTYSEVGAAPSSTVSCTAANIESALGIDFITNTTALNTNGWKTLGGRSSGAKIAISYASSSAADWNSGAYSSSIVFGCSDTKGLLDCGYNSPIVTFGGGNTSASTDNDPKWYFKLSGTSGKTYTLPSDSKTLAASDGSNASGSWGISITGSAGSVAWANVSNHPTNLNQFTNGPGYVTSSGVTSVKLIQGAGITVSSSGTAITTTGERTISITGMDTTNGSTTQWLNKKGGWSTPTAAQVGALASSTVVTNVAISADITTNKEYALVFGTTPSDGTTPTAAKTEGLQKNITKLYTNPSMGMLYSTKFCVNEHVTLQYNTTDSSLEFVFA